MTQFAFSDSTYGRNRHAEGPALDRADTGNRSFRIPGHLDNFCQEHLEATKARIASYSRKLWAS